MEDLDQSFDSQDNQILSSYLSENQSFDNQATRRSEGHVSEHMPSFDSFYRQLQVIPATFMAREDLNVGDKILLPSSTLAALCDFNQRPPSPMVFCIQSHKKHTYCGVLQFIAEQGTCVIPDWMFKMLKFQQKFSSAMIALVKNFQSNKQKLRYFIKIQPHQTKFIDLPNPKSTLQFQLRNYTCLHQGDTISITNFQDTYQIDILQVRPKNDYNAICIVDVDVQVQFAPPLDYQQLENNNSSCSKFIQSSYKKHKKTAFKGKGKRIDQKTPKNIQLAPNKQQYDPRKHRIVRGVRKQNNFRGHGTNFL